MVSDRAPGYAMIWWGMVFAQFVYAGIVIYVVPPRIPGPDPLIPMVLASVAVGSALFGQLVWVQFRRGALATMNPDGAPLHPMAIVAWALDESAGIMGVVVAFLGGAASLSLALMAVSLLALLLNPYWSIEP
jgi:hypothetical protein